MSKTCSESDRWQLLVALRSHMRSIIEFSAHLIHLIALFHAQDLLIQMGQMGLNYPYPQEEFWDNMSSIAYVKETTWGCIQTLVSQNRSQIVAIISAVYVWERKQMPILFKMRMMLG